MKQKTKSSLKLLFFFVIGLGFCGCDEHASELVTFVADEEEGHNTDMTSRNATATNLENRSLLAFGVAATVEEIEQDSGSDNSSQQ